MTSTGSPKKASGRRVSLSTPQRIRKAALKEFSTYGLEGARMARIARQAGANKALLFYYFSSKENLYQEVMKEALNLVVPQLQRALRDVQEPEELIVALPRIYVRFALRHPDYIRMILHELIRQPQAMALRMAKALKSYQPSPPLEMKKTISGWGARGLLNEKNPAQLALNLLPPMIFTPILAPVVEALFQEKLVGSPRFLSRRIESLTQFFKKGVLP